jgi:hypothetical protein
MVWRLLLPERDTDSLLGMDTINLMCTLAWRTASYQVHSLVAHGCIILLTRAGEKMMICISGRKRCFEKKQEYMEIFLPNNQPLSCSTRQKRAVYEEESQWEDSAPLVGQ